MASPSFLKTFSSRIDAGQSASSLRNAAETEPVTTSILCALITFVDLMIDSPTFANAFGDAARASENATSCAVTGSPLEKRAFFRRLKV